MLLLLQVKSQLLPAFSYSMPRIIPLWCFNPYILELIICWE